jgi:hypothetical protein
MNRNLFIATAVLLLSACQHVPRAGDAPLLPGALDLHMGRPIASAPAIRAAAADPDQPVRARGNPTESDLRCTGWGQCDSKRG